MWFGFACFVCLIWLVVVDLALVGFVCSGSGFECFMVCGGSCVWLSLWSALWLNLWLALWLVGFVDWFARLFYLAERVRFVL